MKENEKLKLLEETFNMDEGSLRANMLLDDINEYDSMAKLSLIVMFDEEFEKKVDGDKVKTFKTVEDILALMDK